MTPQSVDLALWKLLGGKSGPEMVGLYYALLVMQRKMSRRDASVHMAAAEAQAGA